MYPIRLLNKRDRTTNYPTDLLIFDIDRTCPIMGNPIILHDVNDEDERESVLVQYRAYFEEEYAKNGEFTQRVKYFTDLVSSGKKVALRCWCAPKQCHGHVIIEKINENLETVMTQANVQATPEFLKQRFSKEEIEYTEARHVIHMPKRRGQIDFHMVKEQVHLKDGRVVPNIRYIRNFKKKFWVTSPRFRSSYKQKREWETRDRLIESETTESDLAINVARALGEMRLADKPHQLKDSPYVYGLDVPSTVALKQKYFEAMEGKAHTPYNVAYSDTETNMLGIEEGASKHIIMQSLFFEGKLYTVILEDFLRTVPRPQETLREMYDEYFPQQGKDLVKDWEVVIVKEPIDIVKLILLRCHEWQPDFLSFWNMIFDLDKMIECIELAGYRPEDLFCDPKLPKELRYAFLKRANPSKTSASGRLQTKKPFDQWHSYLVPASFYIVDQMATYRFVRKSKQLEPSYSLDNILKKECKGLGKLKHSAADGLTKGEFHIFMQQKYPGEYVIYHIWDAVCMHLLTIATKDLDYSMPGSTGFSDFMSFESEPKRYVHQFHYFILKNHDAVTGVSGKSLVQELDSQTIPGKGHIVTLEPHLTVDTGLKIFKDYPGLQTNFYSHAADLDVKSSYPYGQWVFNMSRQTTVRELIEIEGVRDQVRRIQGLNFSGGRSNAIEFSTEIFKLPTLVELSKLYDEEHA